MAIDKDKLIRCLNEQSELKEKIILTKDGNWDCVVKNITTIPNRFKRNNKGL